MMMIDDRIAQFATEVVANANRAVGLLEAYNAATAKNAAIARSQAAKVREAANTALQKSLQNTLRTARDHALGYAIRLAPGPLGERWEEIETQEQGADVLAAAEHVRCGSLFLRTHGAAPNEVPLILPFLDRGNFQIAATVGCRDAVTGALQEIRLRSLLGTGAGQLSLLTFDPKLSASLAVFSPASGRQRGRRQAGALSYRRTAGAVRGPGPRFQAHIRHVWRCTNVSEW